MPRLTFAGCIFDSSRCLFSRDGQRVHLTRKAFLLLELLIERRPAVVTKQQILEHLWPDCFVHEGSVASLVSEIRRALGKEALSFIRTVHGVGYAFGAPLGLVEAPLVADWKRTMLIEKGPPPRVNDLREGDTLIGRAESCDVRVWSSTVSREHARIRLTSGAASLQDLGSRNGTYLRGGRIGEEPAPLASGDEIRVGTVELIFRVEIAADGETESVI